MLVKNKTNVYDCQFRLVFVTKYRYPAFDTDEKRAFLKNELTTIAQNKGIAIEHLEVKSDQVHLLVSFPPQESASNVAKSFKGTSSRMFFKEFPEVQNNLWRGHLWSNSFFVSTVGNVSEAVVEEYVKKQMTTAMQRQMDYQKQNH